MPGTSNPVSGFGGSNGGSSSNKPSFFSQLNLKAGRKSFGGPTDHANDQPVLVIDPEDPELNYGGTRGTSQENRVVLNDESDTGRPGQMRKEPYSNGPSKEGLARPKHYISHSLPASPVDTHTSLYSLNSQTDIHISPVKGATPDTMVDPNDSGLSKRLPDFSIDLSLLVDEQLPPDTASQSDHHPDSRNLVMNIGSSNYGQHQTVTAPPPILESSPTKLIKHSPIQRGEPSANVSTLSNIPQGGLETMKAALYRSTDTTIENTSASFDLSTARLSLDLMRHSLGEDWAKSVMIENSSVPSADASALLPPESSIQVVGNGSGPVTSTPFLSPSASPLQSKNNERDISFDLDALDPDLVALLQSSNVNRGPSQVNRVVTPSPLEPFAPPPDPLNPGTTVKYPAITAFPSLSSKQETSTPLPIRKFATVSASASPARQLRLPRSYTAQDIFPPPKSSKPAEAPATDADLTWQESHTRKDGRSPTSAITLSDNGTKSDVSKQPSPLSATPLTLDDLPHNASTMESFMGSSYVSNITTRRKGRTAIPAPVQSPSPVSMLTSSIDSRCTAHVPRSRDRDFSPTSVLPEMHGPYPHTFGSTGRERDHVRPPIQGLFSNPPSPDRAAGDAGRPSSAGAGRLPDSFHTRFNAVYASSRDREWEPSTEGRYRKRSMSLDQSSSGLDGRADDFQAYGGFNSRRELGNRQRLIESVGHNESQYAFNTASGLGIPYDGRDFDKDRERYGYGNRNGYGERERSVRAHTDWLGPRTAKAFAAAGLLDDTRDATGLRYGGFSRSASDRGLRTPGSGSSRERRSPIHGGFPSLDVERDRYSLAISGRTNDRESRSSGVRSGAVSPSTTFSARPISRNDSWSHSRPAPRTTSDLMSHRGSADGRDSASGMHPRTGSVYSMGGGGTGGGSAGSGGGRASPTTTSSLLAMQSQIQILKEKHDTQTEALLAALADSQRTSRELKEENEKLKGQVRSLEERLVEAIANSRLKEKELLRAMRTKPVSSPDRTRTVISRETEFSVQPRPPPSRPSHRSTPSPTKRRPSTSSSVFPAIPGSMSLLIAETPGSPPQESFGSASGSSPPSPTMVLPRLSSKQKSPEPRQVGEDNVKPLLSSQPVTISHKRSTSGASVATSANFSFETGSPGSLKLKPEHELLLGDMTRLSLATGFDGDSEAET